MRNRVFMLTLAVVLLLPLAYAGAQTMTTAPTVTASTPPPSTPPPPPPSGTSAFDQLSPGGQRIALALYQAQVKPQTSSTPSSGTVGSGTGTTTPTRLTLDQIAQRKLDGHGWGQVFKSMKSEGLVRQKNLGQVVSSYNHRQRHDFGHHAQKHHDGDRHEGYARHDGHDRHEGYQHREGHRMYSRDGRGYEGRGNEGRSYQGGGGNGDQGSRVATSSRPTYTAAGSNDGGRGYQAGSTARQGGGPGTGHSK